MRLTSSEKGTRFYGSAITIGSFDGVHLGHQKIIRSVVEHAHQNVSAAVVVTFFPHPSKVLRKIEAPFYLNTIEEKTEALKNLGVDAVETITFSPQFARTPAEKFIRDLHNRLKFSKLIVGSDFKMGADRRGDINLISKMGAELGYEVQAVSVKQQDGNIISSSRIRDFLRKGELRQANQLLGRWYELRGAIVHGDGRGKHIGIPTANIAVWPEKLIPSTGVYAAFSEIEGRSYNSVVNIGHRPTFYQPGAEQTVEVHILQFNQDIYGKQMILKLVERIRSERKFSSAEELMQQIETDIQQSKEILAHATSPQNLPVGS